MMYKEASTPPISLTTWNYIRAIYPAKCLGQYLAKIFHFIQGQLLTQINSRLLDKFDTVCVDAA